MGTPYTHGRWKVREGRQDEFVAAWRDFAQVAADRGATGIRLLQDIDTPSFFYSFGSWGDQDQIVAFRDGSEFQLHVDALQEMVETFEPLRCESRLELGQMG